MSEAADPSDEVAHATVRAMTELLRERAKPLALACRRAEVAASIVSEASSRKSEEVVEAKRRNAHLQSLVRPRGLLRVPAASTPWDVPVGFRV